MCPWALPSIWDVSTEFPALPRVVVASWESESKWWVEHTAFQENATEKPPNTTLGGTPESTVSCLFSRSASKRKQLSNPDKSQSSQSWPLDCSRTKESPRTGLVTCTCSCRCSPGLPGQTQGSPCAHQPQTAGLLPWHTRPRPRSCPPGGPAAADAAPPVREPEHMDVKCTGCSYMGNSETRAEQTPGNSFLCHHSKKHSPLSRNARKKYRMHH